MKKLGEVKIFDKHLAEHIGIFFLAWITPIAFAKFYPNLQHDFYQFLIALGVYIFLEIFIYKISPLLRQKMNLEKP